MYILLVDAGGSTVTRDEHFTISDGVGRTLRLHAGPTSEAEAVEAAEDVADPSVRVVDRGTFDLLTMVSGYDLEDRRDHEGRAGR